jgi:ribosomal protein L37AE/L43A
MQLTPKQKREWRNALARERRTGKCAECDADYLQPCKAGGMACPTCGRHKGRAALKAQQGTTRGE